MSSVLDRPSATDADRELRADLVGRAAKLLPLLAADARRGDDERLVAEENITAIEEAGLLSLMRPKRFGGLQTDVRTLLEVSREGLVLIPSTELAIEDTWFVSGMRGTASNTLVGEGIFVPAHRYLSVPRAIQGEVATPFRKEPLYRAAFVPVAALVLAGPQLGLATAALDLVLDKAPKRTVTYTFYETQSSAPTVQLAVARAASLIDSAHLHAYRAAAEIDESAHRGVYPDYDARAKARMDTGVAVSCAREAIRVLMSAHGAASFAESSPLQRIWRDSEVASRHVVASPEISAEVYGKSLLGIRGDVTPLV